MFAEGQDGGQFRNPFQPLPDHLVHGLPGDAAPLGKLAYIEIGIGHLAGNQFQRPDIERRHEGDDLKQVGARIPAVLFGAPVTVVRRAAVPGEDPLIEFIRQRVGRKQRQVARVPAMAFMPATAAFRQLAEIESITV